MVWFFCFGFFMCGGVNLGVLEGVSDLEKRVGTTDVACGLESVTLEDALAKSVAGNQELKSVWREIEAMEGVLVQSRARPNPEIGVDFENVAGSNGFSGFDQVEKTVELGQLIEFGGKRAKRIRVATQDRELSRLDYEAKRLDLLAETKMVFFEVLAGQEKVQLAKELLALSQRVFSTVAARVDAGKVAAMEQTKASVMLASSQMSLDEHQRSLKGARKRLAALWGDPEYSKFEVQGDLYRVLDVPEEDALAARLEENPDLARWATELEHRQAVVALEKSHRIPDVVLKAGARRFEESGDHAYLFGVSVPLPIFDRNKGTIQQARSDYAKTELDALATKVDVQVAFSQAYQDVTLAFTNVRIFESTIIPATKSVFESASEGYRMGKFSYLELLDAQRTLFEQQEDYIDALASFHNAATELERLLGGDGLGQKGQPGGGS